jgi:protein gp37
MAATTSIEWTDRTWNPVVGCSLVSPGCTNCYAMRMAGRIEAMGTAPHYAGLTRPSKAGPVWTGEVRAAPEHIMTQPLRWWRTPARIFVNSMSDLFHESVPDEVIDRVFAVMALCPQHTFQVLTKRPERMRDYVRGRSGKLARFLVDEYLIKAPDRAIAGRAINAKWPVASVGDIDMPDDIEMRAWPLPNVWLGVSVEDQARADERIPILLDTPAAVRWISAEPLLGPINLTRLPYPNRGRTWMIDAVRGEMREPGLDRTPIGGVVSLNWVVAGGESGPDARPMHPDWVRSLRDQCAAAEVPFLFKQWGEWAPYFTADLHEGIRFAGEGKDKRVHVSFEGGSYGNPHLPGDFTMYRLGKRRSGRLLDCALHDAYPEPRP